MDVTSIVESGTQFPVGWHKGHLRSEAWSLLNTTMTAQHSWHSSARSRSCRAWIRWRRI